MTSKALYRSDLASQPGMLITRPGTSDAEARYHEAKASDVTLSYKNTVYERLRTNKICQYQDITPSMTVATVSMNYSKVNFNRIL